MKIGIIVYSKTGNTKSAAENLRERLAGEGHVAAVEEIIPACEVTPGMKEVRFTAAPDVEAYEGIVFASPVQGFSLSAVMKAYLLRIGSLRDKKVGCFVTKQLPGKWTGGNAALRQIEKMSAAKGGDVAWAGIVNWSSKNREEMIDRTVRGLSELFG